MSGVESASLSEVFSKIEPILSSKLKILQESVSNGFPNFLVEEPQENSILKELRKQAEDLGYSLVIRRAQEKKTLSILVVPKFRPQKADVKWNIALLFATIGTVFYAGYVSFEGNHLLNAIEYTLTLFAILVTHESSHYFTSRRHGLAASLPYFIPAIPPIGTFGAMIRAREPFKDRNQLFDVGFSGPFGGFVVACIATLIGVFTSPIKPIASVSNLSPLPFVPLLMLLVSDVVVKQNQVLILNPVAFAAWVGLIVTFLNALPTAQLDGGHVLRSFVSARVHHTISLITALSLIVLSIFVIPSFLIMGILMLLLSAYGHPGSMDDYTRVSKSRKALLFLWVAMLALSLPI